MVARTFAMYSLADLGITSGNYNFSNLTSTGTFTAAPTAAPTTVTVDDTDSQDTIFNDGAPGNFGAPPTQQLLTGTVDGTTFTNEPSNPENEFEVFDSNGIFVGYIYDLHNANSAAFSSLQGYVTTFALIPGETYSVSRTTGLPNLAYSSILTCFVRDTHIKTDKGQIPIQELEVGDRVFTRDNGFQPIRWIGQTSVPAMGKFAPVRICKGALGNERALRVSPQHRMLISGWRAELILGEDEVLVAAKNLVDGESIFIERQPTVQYFHLLFDDHEIILAEGCFSESFLPSDQSLDAQGEAARAELAELFPELFEEDGPLVATARKATRSFEAQVLTQI